MLTNAAFCTHSSRRNSSALFWVGKRAPVIWCKRLRAFLCDRTSGLLSEPLVFPSGFLGALMALLEGQRITRRNKPARLLRKSLLAFLVSRKSVPLWLLGDIAVRERKLLVPFSMGQSPAASCFFPIFFDLEAQKLGGSYRGRNPFRESK